jgi:hypothetical protein
MGDINETSDTYVEAEKFVTYFMRQCEEKRQFWASWHKYNDNIKIKFNKLCLG